MMTNRSDRGSAKPRGSQRFERDDVIREPACGLHQGQQPCGAARTGRTHGCTRPVLINAKNLLHRGGRPHMASDSRILDTYLGAGAVHPITSRLGNRWMPAAGSFCRSTYRSGAAGLSQPSPSVIVRADQDIRSKRIRGEWALP